MVTSKELRRRLSEILRLPPSVVPVACIAIGHPGEVLNPGDRIEALVLNLDKDKRRIGLSLDTSRPTGVETTAPAEQARTAAAPEKSVGTFHWTSPERLLFNSIRKVGRFAQPFGTGEWYSVNADGSMPRVLEMGSKGARDMLSTPPASARVISPALMPRAT